MPKRKHRDDKSNCSWIDHLHQLKGAYSENTIRAYREDFGSFENWCRTERKVFLPASPETVAAYAEVLAIDLTPATIGRKMAGIGRIHRLFGHANPAASDLVKVVLRRIRRAKGRRPKQALSLSGQLHATLIDACGDDLRGRRDKAMIAVGYDTLCRCSELVQLRVEDVGRLPDGDASILIRRSKTDQTGQGRLGYLSAATVTQLNVWLAASGITSGPIFRGISGSIVGRRALHPHAVSRVLRRIAGQAGLTPQICKRLTSHSMRVGAAVEMAEHGIDLVPIMHAGGWRSPGMVVRYTEQIDLRKSGMAKLYALRKQEPT
jgi:integrase